MTEIFDPRIMFHDDLQTMEVNFSGFEFDTSAIVNAFYDRIEERIAQTARSHWFFLVNYSDCRIDSTAWAAFARRGKALNLAHSIASVRFDTSEATRRQIERDAESERFDPNLCVDHQSALARLRALAAQHATPPVPATAFTADDFARRLSFDPERAVMEVDFTDLTLHNARDVDLLYDVLEARINGTGRKWFFLVNMQGCRIMSAAWVRYAQRGKRLNLASSLGSVRYAPGEETEADIRLRAESQHFTPNIRTSREEALTRIAEMKQASLTQTS
nr:hypothetical protein [Aquicoccus sp. G2-2]MEA1115146.1 hypothetical protein [Aquicoccus sp. G2-2]